MFPSEFYASHKVSLCVNNKEKGVYLYSLHILIESVLVRFCSPSQTPSENDSREFILLLSASSQGR